MAYWQNSPSTTTPINATNLNNLAGGWTSITETLTYSSADAPTFVISTSADTTSYLSVGMKIKLTQTTVKYFIITAITSTTITVYGGTDYTLTNAAISEVFYSVHRSPYGFPSQTAKWTVRIVDGTNTAQTSPTTNTWYNTGSRGITIPIGSWNVRYECEVYSTLASAGATIIKTTLSTGNNNESSTQHTTRWAATSVTFFLASISKGMPITVTSKTAYYLNILHSGTASNIGFNGAQVPTIIEAVCAYL
jgi:hypothetical protein